MIHMSQSEKLWKKNQLFGGSVHMETVARGRRNHFKGPQAKKVVSHQSGVYFHTSGLFLV